MSLSLCPNWLSFYFKWNESCFLSQVLITPSLPFKFTVMPSSPKFFHARTSPPATPHTRSTLLIFAFLLTFAIVSFLFALSSFLSSGGSGYRCRNSDPRSVRVIWDKTGHGNNGRSAAGDDDGTKRHKIMGFVGIQTGFGSTGRRQSLRKTWMPADRQGLQRYICFVIERLSSVWINFTF